MSKRVADNAEEAPTDAEEVERLRSIKARARHVAFHDGPLWSVPTPELHWIGQYILNGDPAVQS